MLGTTAAAGEGRGVHSEEQSGAMRTILVVDDNPIDRELLLVLLGAGGHRVLQAQDGGEALDLVRVGGERYEADTGRGRVSLELLAERQPVFPG